MRPLSAALFLLAIGCDDGGGTVPVTLADPCADSGTLCTWLGRIGLGGMGEENLSRADTLLYLPIDLAFAADGSAVYPDYNNHRVRRVATNGRVGTIAGGTGLFGMVGDCDLGCDPLATSLNHPTDAVPNPAVPGEVAIALPREGGPYWVVPSANVLWGQALDADVAPSSLAYDADGTLYLSDGEDSAIYRLAPGSDAPELLAGTPGAPGAGGDGGPAIDAQLGASEWNRITVAGRTLYVADTVNEVVRAIDLDTGIIERVAGTLSTGGDAGDGGDALAAQFCGPTDVAMGAAGELYVVDSQNSCVRVIRDGTIETFAGICGDRGADGDGGPAVGARLGAPIGVAVDGEGAVYVADTLNHAIRRVAP